MYTVSHQWYLFYDKINTCQHLSNGESSFINKFIISQSTHMNPSADSRHATTNDHADRHLTLIA